MGLYFQKHKYTSAMMGQVYTEQKTMAIVKVLLLYLLDTAGQHVSLDGSGIRLCCLWLLLLMMPSLTLMLLLLLLLGSNCDL